METVVGLIAWGLAVIVAVPMFVVIFETLAALFYRGKRSGKVRDPEGLPSAVVLVPAHNEEGVIRQCLASLKDDLPVKARIVCIAHNCTDATADIARQCGAEVVEVNDEGSGGKPDALKAGMRALDENPPDVVVIIDADCIVEPGTLNALVLSAWGLRRPVMGVYRFAPASGDVGLSGISSLAAMLKNHVRPLGLHVLGLPCLLNGSGSAYPFRLLRDVPHGDGSIAEDYQLAVDLLVRGYPASFVPEAGIDGRLPGRTESALGQRRRWEHGHLYLAFRTAPFLLLGGLLRLDLARVAIALELLVPPLAFLGLMWVLAMLVALVYYGLYGAGAPLTFLAAVMAAFILFIVMSWFRFAGMARTVSALAAIPAYLAWKLPMYRAFFTHREKRWVKTDRD